MTEEVNIENEAKMEVAQITLSYRPGKGFYCQIEHTVLGTTWSKACPSEIGALEELVKRYDLLTTPRQATPR